MQTTAKLISQIREALASGGQDYSFESLAAEYTRQAQEANHRLESCSAMLANGSEYQALQLAETEPVLMDLMATLSFAEAPDWVRWCASQQLPAPPKFDSRAIQALDKLYAKGIEANHPLYKDYRAAVTARDDVRALQIIRSIARLNPADENAKVELDRWEKKSFHAKLQSLKSALACGHEEPILHELAELERLAPPERLADLPEFTKAVAIRRDVDRREAIQLVERLLAAIQEERKAGGWRLIGEHLSKITRLQSQHGFKLTPEQAGASVEMQLYFDQQRSAAEVTARFQDVLRTVDAMTQQLETRLLTHSTLTLRESEHLYLEYNRRWKEVEVFQRAAPEPLTSRVRNVATSLRSNVNRLQRRRRNSIIAGTVAGLAAVGVAMFFAIRSYRVNDHARQLATLRDAGQVEAAEKMASHIRKDLPNLAAQAALRARLDETERWTQDQRARRADADSRVGRLEKSAEEGFVGGDIGSLGEEFTTTEEFVASLPADLKSGVADRLGVAKSKLEAYLVGVREKLVSEAETELVALETLAGAKLGYDQTVEVIAATLDECDPRLKGLEAKLHPKIPSLELPAAQQVRVNSLRKRQDAFIKELAILGRCREGLLQARTLADYETALSGFKSSKLLDAAEVKAARKTLAVFPKTDDILAALLLPGDPAGWAAAKADLNAGRLMPESVSPLEIQRLLAIRDDSYTSDIWEATVVTPKWSRTVYSRGKILETNPVGEPAWMGSFHYPSPSAPDVVAFMPMATFTTSGGESAVLKNIRRSSPAQCLVDLELNRMTNGDGTQFEKPLLGIFDGLVKDRNAPVLFKAYMMQQLAVILNLDSRSNAWGLQYCPSLRADLAKLTRLCGDEKFQSRDWILERKRTQWNAKLSGFFAELKDRSYLAEARVQREIVRAALRAGLQYGGYIDGEGRSHVHGEAERAALLWANLADGGKIGRYRLPKAEEKADARFARFTPIFYIPIDRDALVADVSRRIGGVTAAQAVLPVAPFFNP